MTPRQRKPTPANPSTLRSTAKHLSSKASQLTSEMDHALLVLWADLAPWQCDNHYIHTGYRRASSSFRASLASLRYLHNETVNIYTHLLGAVLFVLTGLVLHKTLKPRYETASAGDALAFGAFFAGAASCLAMSATYHTLSNHSARLASWGNRLDYLGIVALIVGSFTASVYYGFYCHPALRSLYWTMVCLSSPFASWADGGSAFS